MKIFPMTVATLLISFNACTPKESTPLDPQMELIQHGQRTYQVNCTACHQSNPKLPGSIGPEVFGASKALLEARIIEGNYPPGFTPKRKTNLMPKLPHLKDEIPALEAFLNQKS